MMQRDASVNAFVDCFNGILKTEEVPQSGTNLWSHFCLRYSLRPIALASHVSRLCETVNEAAFQRIEGNINKWESKDRRRILFWLRFGLRIYAVSGVRIATS